MRYLIALPLKDADSKDFIKLRDQYKDLAPKWKITLGPHITLFRPSEYLADKDQAIEIFKKAPKFKAFNAMFKGFEAFLNHSNNAVYSQPTSYDEFQKIKQVYEPTAGQILQDTTEIWPFHPHLTLVNRLDTTSAKKLLTNLEPLNFSAEYFFDRICLYKKLAEDRTWVEIASNMLS